MEKAIEEKIITKPPRRVEIIDDFVFMSPAPSVRHHRIMGAIYLAFYSYLRGKRCTVDQVINVYFNPDKPKNHIIPDISVMCEPDKFKPNGYYGVPSLIVEILSSNRKDDLITKFNLYERIGVGEYWIVDPISNAINQYVLVDGKYKLLNAHQYVPQEELEWLDESDQEEYQSSIQVNLFQDLEIELIDIFEN